MIKSLDRLLQLIALLFFAVVGLAHANLGESGDRIDDSYGGGTTGKLVERHLRNDGTVTVLYHKDRYLYFVVFDNNRSVLERYSRVDGRELSPKEIDKFLKANGGRATWHRIDEANKQRYQRSDGKVEAKYAEVDDRPTLAVRFAGKGER